MSLGLIRLEIEGGLKMLRGGGGLAKRAQYLSQCNMGRGVARVGAKKVFVKRGGFARVHELLFAFEDCEVVRVAGHDLKPYFAHFIRALRAEDDAAGRT